jgi:hypothetical protein
MGILEKKYAVITTSPNLWEKGLFWFIPSLEPTHVGASEALTLVSPFLTKEKHGTVEVRSSFKPRIYCREEVTKPCIHRCFNVTEFLQDNRNRHGN